MAHRTNYLWREKGLLRATKSRHGATGIPDTLLLSGPDHQRQLFEEQIETDGLVAFDDLYPPGLADGCLLIDVDQHTVLYDGCAEISSGGWERRATGAAFRHVWPGWTLLHARYGMLDIGRYLGLSATGHANLGAPKPRYTPDYVLKRDLDWPWQYAEEVEVLLTDETGHTTSKVLDLFLTPLLHLGPVLCEVLPRAVPIPDASDPLWAIVHFDLPNRTLRFWHDLPEFGAEERIRTWWPGWNVQRLSTREAARLTHHPQHFNLSAEQAERAIRCLIESMRTGKAPYVPRSWPMEELPPHDALIRHLMSACVR